MKLAGKEGNEVEVKINTKEQPPPATKHFLVIIFLTLIALKHCSITPISQTGFRWRTDRDFPNEKTGCKQS